MATATELAINSTATAMDMAQAIFGNGIQVVSATYTGAAVSSGIYSGATSTLGGISPTNSGVILSTGNVADFTNSSGTTNTNTATGTSTDTTGGVEGDTQLNTVAGVATHDGAILQANFIPDGEFLTMRFVFSSEEYPEYVNGGVNDVFGVWVNGTFVPASITSKGDIAIDTVNGTNNQNLYIDNTADQYNTEMDGFTRVLTIKAKVNPGQQNTIKIGIADGGDSIYDSNLLIMGDSIQTIALAFDDMLQLTANSSRTFDLLGNDIDQTDTGLTITHLNGTAVVAGQTVTLQTGEKVRLNADGTVTVTSDGDIGKTNLTYTIVDGAGNVDNGFVTISTVSTATRDGIVQGTAGNDLIDVSYLGDPDGDKIDNNDGTGAYGTTGNADYVLAGAGNDVVTSGAGNDKIYGGTGSDTVYGGAGDDWVTLEAGNDVFGTYGADSEGNDTVYGDAGNDAIIGGGGNDVLYGGTGADTLSGGVGADSAYGGADADWFNITDDHGSDVVDGGESGTDFDQIGFGNYLTTGGVQVTFTGAEAGTYTYTQTPAALPVAAGSFVGIEGISGTGYADTINGALNTAAMTVNAGAGADVVTGGSGNDVLSGGTGADSLTGGAGADTLGGADDADTITAAAGDVVDGGEGGVDTDTLIVNGVQSINWGANTENGVVTFTSGGTLSFSNIETLVVDGSVVPAPNYVVDGTAGDDLIDASYQGDPQGDRIDANDNATDTNEDLVLAGAGNDTVLSGAGADTLNGEDGADILIAGDGADVLYGGSGADTLAGGVGADTFNGGTGLDVVDYSTSNAAVSVNLQSGVVSGGDAQGDVLASGVDGVTGSGFDDTLTGADGYSANLADPYTSLIHGGGGNDLIDGGSGPDSLYGDAGNDTMVGGADADLIWGNDDSDLIYGGSGDTVDGGEGGQDYDRLAASGVTSVSFDPMNPENGVLTFVDNSTLTFTNIEKLVLNGGNPDGIIWGTAGADSIGAGYVDANGDIVDANDAILPGDTGHDDEIQAGDGADTVAAGAGNDRVYGGTGADSITGGVGADQLYGGDEADWVDGGDDADLLAGGQGHDTLKGGSAADILAGDTGNDQLFGGVGDDQLAGGDGDDILVGEDGADDLTGGAGNDLLEGGTGNDTLSGGAGNDLLTGGDSADQIDGGDDRDIIFGGYGDTVDGGEGGDDFDVLDLTAYGHPATNIHYDAPNHENGYVEFLDSAGAVVSTLQFSNIESVVACFTPGAMVLTDDGEVAVEELEVGDKVFTRDSGYQELRWVGRRDLPAEALLANPQFRPVLIRRGALGPNLPDRDMMVSPQHRLLITGPRAELLFGEHEVLVAALHLVGLKGIERVAPAATSYIHLLFDAHEIVRADGAWSESFQPGTRTLEGLDSDQRDEVLALFPELATNPASFVAARQTLKAHEARVLMR